MIPVLFPSRTWKLEPERCQLSLDIFGFLAPAETLDGDPSPEVNYPNAFLTLPKGLGKRIPCFSLGSSDRVACVIIRFSTRDWEVWAGELQCFFRLQAPSSEGLGCCVFRFP